MKQNIHIFDTTLRDGAQAAGVHISAEDKAGIAQRLEQFGVATIEAGFPASSPGEREAVERVARTVKHAEVAALARCVEADIDAAAQALAPAAHPVIHVFLGVSDIHVEKKLRMTRPQVIRAIRKAVAHAAATGAAVEFSAEDATRAERPFLRECIGVAVEAGATRINVPDTVGCMTPSEYGPLIRDIVQFVGPDIRVSAHCHDDLGMATANTVAAVQAGASQVEVTVNGIGERAGNACLEEVAVAVELKGIASTGLDLGQMASISQRVAEATGVAPQANRAIVGANAFSHSSGIHQDGLIKDPSCYAFVPPTLVGAEGHRFVLTACSGRGALVHRARALGFDLEGDTVDAAYEAFIETADRKRGAISDEELQVIFERAAPRAM